MTASPFALLRHRLAAAGARTSSTPWVDLDLRAGPAMEAGVEIVERPFAAIDVGAPARWDEAVAFLDGTQHVELVGYVGIDPVVAAVVRAAVRLRHERRTALAVERERRIVVARRAVLDALGSVALASHDAVEIDDAGAGHPIRDLELAHAAVDRARLALEIDVARTFRVSNHCWLIADGSLSSSPEWTSDQRMIGVVKSHGILPLDGEALRTFLTLPAGHRTSVFSPRTRQVTPLHAWGLRLWPWEGRDLFHGLVRVETTATVDALRLADTISRALLAERVPLTSAPRADRLLYGVHDVGRYLRARTASR